MMKCRPHAICAAALLCLAAPVSGQDPTRGPDPDARIQTQGTVRQDSTLVDTAAHARIELDGALLSRLPVDSTERLLRFLPGFRSGIGGADVWRSIDGSVSTYVDGVPVRSASGFAPPINALSAVLLTSGGLSANRSGAVTVEYETLRPAQTWSANAELISNAISPADWDESISRFRFNASGPIPRLSGLYIALSGQLLGQKYEQLPRGGPPVHVPIGVDTTITVGTFSGDSVDVVVPEYAIQNSNALPLGNADRSHVTAALMLDRDRGNYALRYYRTSAQRVGRSLDHLYNPDAWRGRDDVAQVVSLTAQRQLPLGLAASAALSHQRYDFTSGILSPTWTTTERHPLMGFTFGSLGFLADRADYPITEPFLLALRSGVLPLGELTFTSSDDPRLPLLQGIAGGTETLRLNPWALRSGLPISGIGDESTPAGDWQSERRWYGRAALSRQVAATRITAGGEFDRSAVESMLLRLATGTPSAWKETGSTLSGFLEAETWIGGIGVTAGVRADRYATDALISRVPGYVWNIPDSLRADAYTLRPGAEPWDQRIERVVDCGGAATAAARTNSAGAVICRNNFIPVETRTAVSPRIAVAYSGSGRYAARASYGSYAHAPPRISSPYQDLTTTSTDAAFARPMDPVRVNVAEVGLKYMTRPDSWIDLQVFHVTAVNPVAFRRAEFTDPNFQIPIFLVVPHNADSRTTTGIELTALQQSNSRAGALASIAISRTDFEGSGIPSRNRIDPLRASGIAWFDAGTLAPVLSDLMITATALYTQGDRYTRLANLAGGQLAGMFGTGLAGGAFAEELLSSRLPSRTEIDLRMSKGFRVRGATARIVADVRNPLAIDNVHTVFAETGSTENPSYRDARIEQAMFQYGFANTDIVIDTWPENDLNRYMLHRAEQRFGNGDGTFTAAEIASAVSSWLDLSEGPQYLRDGRRELRLGVEIAF